LRQENERNGLTIQVSTRKGRGDPPFFYFSQVPALPHFLPHPPGFCYNAAILLAFVASP
jgi:hypothetical protein